MTVIRTSQSKVTIRVTGQGVQGPSGSGAPHAATHAAGDSDPLTIETLATGGAVGSVPTSDGAGGLTMAVPSGSGNVVSPGGETSARVAAFTGANTIAETATTSADLATAVSHAAIVTGNPHALDAADVGADPAGTAAAAVATHAGLADPHTVYQLESAKGAASGYASLDGSAFVVEPAQAVRVTGTTLTVGAVADGEVLTRSGTTVIGSTPTGVTDHGALSGLADDDHPQYQLVSGKNAVSGYAGLDGSSKLTGSQQVYGASANTACEGNDTRIPTQGENDALVGTSGVPATGNRYVTDSDPRNTDARTPTAHTIASHSDTTATGAELNTLVGGGSTALHSHAVAHSATTGQTANDHHNQVHAFGGADHTAATLAELNALLSDGPVDVATASRPPNGSASGDLGSSYPGPTVVALQGEPLSATTPTEGQTWSYLSGTWTPATPSGGTDANAVHVNVASEISAITEKVTPAGGDFLIIEDSAAGNVKKRVLVGNLPTGGGGEANDLVNAGTGQTMVASPSKVGTNLQARGLTSTTNRITVSGDIPNNNTDLTLVEGNVVHQNLSGAGTNTHAQIDTHIADAANPHAVTAVQAGAEPSGTVSTHNADAAAHAGLVKTDGTRAFTGEVSGVTPTTSAALATKGYVDGAGFELLANKNAASGYAGLTAGKLAGAQQVYGTGANTACEGDDARLSDARAPNGSATGDLGGSYPSPTVSAITTTTGPTSLVVGAVADGQMLVRSGATIIGATAGASDHGALTGLADDDHPQYQLVSGKDAASGYPGLSAGSKIAGAQVTYGTGANTACEGNDSRLSDSRTPTTHAASHSDGGSDEITIENLATAGAVGTVPTSDGAGGLTMSTPAGGGDVTGPASAVDNRIATFDLTTGKLIQDSGVGIADVELLANKNAVSGYAGLDGSSKLTGSQQVYGTGVNTACEGNDSRLSDSRAPNGSASGDLGSTYPAPTVVALRGQSVSAATPAEGSELVSLSSVWTPTLRTYVWGLTVNGPLTATKTREQVLVVPFAATITKVTVTANEPVTTGNFDFQVDCGPDDDAYVGGDLVTNVVITTGSNKQVASGALSFAVVANDRLSVSVVTATGTQPNTDHRANFNVAVEYTRTT